jgi:hypothetical protein
MGSRPPLLNTTSKRALCSALLAIPTAILAFLISDKAEIPDWLRYALSPGWTFGFHSTKPQLCGGIFDCIGELTREISQAAEIALTVNVVIYGLLIFGVMTTISALKAKRPDTM